MTIDYRIRNIVIAAALAAAAVLLTVIYVTSARDDEAAGKQSVTVYVPTKSFAIGASGAKVAGSMKEQSVPRDTLVKGAVTSPDQIKGLYLVQPVVRGEQLTLERFAQADEQGIRAKLVGNQRAFQLSGDTNQVLAGTLVPGDRVDVVANVRNPANANDVKAAVALRDVRVLQTEDGDAGASIDEPEASGLHAVVLAVTDEQSKTLFFVTKNGDWTLQLRPVRKPKDGGSRPVTFDTVLTGATR